MIDLLAALVAALLILVGAFIIAGPALTRWIRLPKRSLPSLRVRGRRVTMPKPSVGGFHDLHPTSQRVVGIASKIEGLLRTNTLEVEAREIRGASQRLRTDEANGIYAMQVALRRLKTVRLRGAGEDRRLQQLVSELAGAVKDRAEQLELLPFV